jgi:hypothetical protein
MANHPLFATLNHFAADLGIPKRVKIIAGWYKSHKARVAGAKARSCISVAGFVSDPASKDCFRY